MKSFFVSRSVVPLFATVALLVSILSLSISSTTLYALEQSNPVLLALGTFRHTHHLDGSNSDYSEASQLQLHSNDMKVVVLGTGSESPESPSNTPQQEQPHQQQQSLPLQDFYPFEDPIPNPEPADGYNTFSACMLVMDDNHRLIEWLAYHYHVLPLRHLIVAVDPRSRTSPTFIFNRWRRQGMHIEEWTDSDFWRPDMKLKPIADDAELQTKRDRHRGRQKYFYRRCLMHLKQANRTFVTLNDSDEYVVFNHAGGENYQAWEAVHQARHEASTLAAKHTRVKPSQTPPTTAQAGAMLEYIRHEKEAGLEYYQSPCLGIPRLMFGAQQDTDTAEQRLKTARAIFDSPDQFDTLRWRHHAHRNDFVKNALGKVIMDVSRIDIAASPNFMSLHRPIKTICNAPWHNDWDSGLRINHYLGDWESYSFRNDARRGGERSREQWEYKATTAGEETDDNIRPWLDGFVQTHGPAKSKELLGDAGLPASYHSNTSADTRWSLLPEKLEKILSSDKTVANDNKMVAFDTWVRNKYKDAPTAEGRRG